MNGIVIVDEKWGIGKDNDLLIHLPKDLEYFKNKTVGKVIVIGRKTLESFPKKKPLPNRTNIVLSTDESLEGGDYVLCKNMDELDKELSKYDQEDIFVAGGASIYEQFLPKCDKVYVTKIYREFEADRFFKNLDEDDNFKIGWIGDTIEENGVSYQFFRYDRNKR